MDYQLIGSWLGLPPGPWPPDHYSLLGLQPGEANIERIEQSVHERLMRVRRYQLTHAALATEAMTRLARAFDCLTNPAAKKAYDEAHFPQLPKAQAPLSSSRTPTVVSTDTAKSLPAAPAPPAPAQPVWWGEQQPSWQKPGEAPPVRQPAGNGPVPPPMALPVEGTEPPPVRVLMGIPVLGPSPPVVQVAPPAPPVVQVVPPAPVVQVAPPVPPVVQVAPPSPPVEQVVPPSPPAVQASLPPPELSPAPVGVPLPSPPTADSFKALPPVAAPRLPTDPLLESIRSSPVVRRGLLLRRGLHERVLWLRRLQRAWERFGKYAHRPKRRLSKLAEETELSRLLETIDDLLQEAPAMIGEPGQPGYRVVALAQQVPVVERFKALDDHDRALLARDWVAGRELLGAYRRFLRQQIQLQRRLTRMQRLGRRIDALLTEHLVALLLTLGLVVVLALVVAFFV
jgi:hypothetical protein